MPSSRSSRRSHLKRLSAVGASAVAVSFAGCLDRFSEGPEPEVTSVESNQDLGQVLSGTVEIRAFVVNNGDSGDVVVTARTWDSDDNLLDSASETVKVRNGESQQVDFEISPSEGAESFDAIAEAA